MFLILLYSREFSFVCFTSTFFSYFRFHFHCQLQFSLISWIKPCSRSCSFSLLMHFCLLLLLIKCVATSIHEQEKQQVAESEYILLFVDDSNFQVSHNNATLRFIIGKIRSRFQFNKGIARRLFMQLRRFYFGSSLLASLQCIIFFAIFIVINRIQWIQYYSVSNESYDNLRQAWTVHEHYLQKSKIPRQWSTFK